MILDSETIIAIASALVVRSGILTAIAVGAVTLMWIALSKSGL